MKKEVWAHAIKTSTFGQQAIRVLQCKPQVEQISAYKDHELSINKNTNSLIPVYQHIWSQIPLLGIKLCREWVIWCYSTPYSISQLIYLTCLLIPRYFCDKFSLGETTSKCCILSGLIITKYKWLSMKNQRINTLWLQAISKGSERPGTPGAPLAHSGM